MKNEGRKEDYLDYILLDCKYVGLGELWLTILGNVIMGLLIYKCERANTSQI